MNVLIALAILGYVLYKITPAIDRIGKKRRR